MIGSRSLGGEAHLIHVKLDRLDRIGELEREVFLLVSLDQRHPNIETFPLRRIRPAINQRLDFLKGSPVVSFCLDRFDVHNKLRQIVRASIASYWACVPINRTYTTQYA